MDIQRTKFDPPDVVCFWVLPMTVLHTTGMQTNCYKSDIWIQGTLKQVIPSKAQFKKLCKITATCCDYFQAFALIARRVTVFRLKQLLRGIAWIQIFTTLQTLVRELLNVEIIVNARF